MTLWEALRKILTAMFLFAGTCFFVAGFLFFCELVELAAASAKP